MGKMKKYLTITNPNNNDNINAMCKEVNVNGRVVPATDGIFVVETDRDPNEIIALLSAGGRGGNVAVVSVENMGFKGDMQFGYALSELMKKSTT